MRTRDEHDVDLYIGAMIAFVRKAHGIGSHRLDERLGTTPGVTDKYEAAKRSLSIERLCGYAAIFGLDVVSFFPTEENQAGGATPGAVTHPIGLDIGAAIRKRRMELGLKQADLGDRLGTTFQQVQKYERGKSRVGAARLYMIARALEVPIGYFFRR